MAYNRYRDSVDQGRFSTGIKSPLAGIQQPYIRSPVSSSTTFLLPRINQNRVVKEESQTTKSQLQNLEKIVKDQQKRIDKLTLNSLNDNHKHFDEYNNDNDNEQRGQQGKFSHPKQIQQIITPSK